MVPVTQALIQILLWRLEVVSGAFGPAFSLSGARGVGTKDLRAFKIVNHALAPLAAPDAARLFLKRVHRPLRAEDWKDMAAPTSTAREHVPFGQAGRLGSCWILKSYFSPHFSVSCPVNVVKLPRRNPCGERTTESRPRLRVRPAAPMLRTPVH